MKRAFYMIGRQVAVPRRASDVILLASLLAFGVVAWEHIFHSYLLGTHGDSVSGHLVHWLRDSFLALPLALVAVVGGLWLAERLGRVGDAGNHLLWRAALVSMIFVLLLVPSVGAHELIDGALAGGEGEAGHSHVQGASGLEEASGIKGLALHGARDAFVGWAAAALPLATLALSFAGAREGGRRRRQPKREAPGQVFDWVEPKPLHEISRRELLRYGAAGGVVLALGASGLLVWPAGARRASGGSISSPFVSPFSLPLNIPPLAVPVSSDATTDFYVLRQQVAQAEILPGLLTTFWGYNGITPGPTFRQRKGRNAVVRQINELPVPVTVHRHGGDQAADSDGHPEDLIPAGIAGGPPRGIEACAEEGHPVRTENFQDYFYPGLQPAGTIWYHDHAIHKTGRNVYLGLAGFYLIEDDEERSLGLPGSPPDDPKFEVPLVIQDRLFASDGSLIYQCHDAERPLRQGMFGDTILVNGVPTPFMQVARRKYRFRFLNGSNARILRLALSTGDPFKAIGTDVGLLAKPVETAEILMMPAERYEVIIDFSRYPLGTKVVLENRFGRAFGDPVDEERVRQVMRFDVVEEAADRSSDTFLVDLPDVKEADAVRTRDWRFERQGGAWAINQKLFDPERIDAFPAQGSVEIWRFINNAGGWGHPIHPHGAFFLMLDRNGEAPRPFERGPKDTAFLGGNEVIRVAVRFTENFKGVYAFHCHNIEHEDFDMMTQFEVV